MSTRSVLMQLAMVETRIERRRLFEKSTTAVAMLLDSPTFLRLNKKLPGNFYPVNLGSVDLLQFGKSVMENPDSRFTVTKVRRSHWTSNHWASLGADFQTDEISQAEDFKKLYSEWSKSSMGERSKIISITLLDRVVGIELVLDYLGKVEVLSDGVGSDTLEAFEIAFARYQDSFSG